MSKGMKKFSINATPQLQNELNSIKTTLLKQPLVLLHRDFQSQNIMINEEKITLIDFQGMRLGCAFYDVASLLLDPYVSLPQELISDLLQLYLRTNPSDEHLQLFYTAGCQRLMQALGAFGFLSIKRNKPEYTQYFKPAAQRLHLCAKKLGMENLQSIAKQIEQASS